MSIDESLSVAERLALVRLAKAAGLARSSVQLRAIERADRGGRLPLSFAQQRLWFLEQMGGLGSAYHIPGRLRLRGELDRPALVRALDRLVARHEPLRTTFSAHDGEPEQRIGPETSRFHLVEQDLSREAGEALERVMDEEATARFDLEHGPLIRGRLVRLADDDHLLLLTMHHIVADGWSMSVLLGELNRLYAAFRDGRPDPHSELPIQYADYAAWQRRWAEGPVLEAQAEYWTRTLAGAPELIALPADHPRPSRQDHAGAEVGLVLDEALTAGLKELSRAHGTTLFMTLLAGWATVLGRLSVQDDVVVGTVTANRDRPEIEGLVGFFINTLALRIDLSGRPTVAEVLRRVKARALEAQANQDIPFEQVVELVQPARSRSHTPLFQVAIDWQNAPKGEMRLSGLELKGVAGAERTTAKVDLALTLREAGGRIVGSATYATALFERATVERYMGYLARVLEQMVADEGRRIEALRLLPDHEHAQVVEEWNATAAPYPLGTCVHDLIEAQAARTPDAVAVVFQDRRLTYAELDGRANALARRLRSHGVGPGSYVPVLMDRCIEVPVAFLGVLKAGAAFVPLHPRWPVDRLRAAVDELDAPLVLTAAGAAAADPPLGRPLLPVGGDETAAPLGLRVDGRAPMYAIYTSGSTGRPKAAVVAHQGVANRFHWMTEAFGAESAAVMLQTVMHVFDGAVVQLLWPLTLGGRTVIPRPDGESDPVYLAGLSEDEGVTMRGFVPSILRTFVAQLATGGREGQRQLAPLRSVILHGEQLDAEATYAFMAHVPRIRVFNMYGPTEATIGSIGYELTGGGNGRIPIGRPIANTRAYILGPGLEPVPVGVTGEIYLGGVCVGLGYLKAGAKTAAAFVPDPFGEPGARLYRTGDLGRWRPDGVIEFLGRADTQVKVRGFRIEPGEIEARLAEHDGVREAVVVAREDAAGDQRLVAYYVGEAVEIEALRAHLSQRLPEYMVPAAYVRLERLPLTPNGKVDRRALPAPDDEAYARRGYEAPVGETERALAEIWSELLGLERVGRRDNFFELGGHSLLVVQLVSRIRQVLGAEVEIGLVFERPALTELAEALAAAGRADLPAIERADRGARLPLSFAQQRLWFIEQLGNLGSTYHIPGRLRLRGELDREALVRALDRLVARHEALRTTFSVQGGEPEQRIAPETSRFHLLEHDLSGEAEEALGRVMAEEAAAPFDLERGPLIRGRLVRLAEDDHVLLLTLHHIVSDGWSMDVLKRELGELYAAFRAGEPDPLPALPIQYADYAAWQRRWVEDRVLEAQAGYWTETLAGAPQLLELPTDHPRPSRQDHAGASLRLKLDEELTAGLKALSRRHGTTLFMTLLAGWATVLGRLSGQGDVVVGTPTANRGRREIEGLIGFFVNMLALRVDLSEQPTVAEVLARVKAQALVAQQNQDIPFEQVVELVQPARSLSHTPLFQVVFTWHDAPRGGVELPGLRLGGVPGAQQTTAKFDLSLALSEVDGRIGGSITYATALFARETVERHVAYLLRVLEQMVADDAEMVDRLELLPEAERRLVVEEWNATGQPYPTDGLRVHDLFRAQAARTPGAVALSWRGERWTYAELEARANQVANALGRRGVGPEVRVGICLPRTPDLVTAMLGVLGAGGAYVPLDPAYPSERLGYMVEDARVALIITDSVLADRLPEGAAALLLLDRERETIEAEPADAPESGVLAENLSHVIFTSGSTGRPKGVMIRHSSVVVLLHWLRENVTDQERSSVLFSTSINFDVSVAEVFGTLAWGGKLVLVENALELPGAQEEVVHVSMAPSAAAELLRSGGIPASVKTLNLGGEALPNALAQGLYGLGTVEKVGNLYGPTEDTTYSTYHVVPRGADQVLVGTPVANTRAYVLDRHLQPVPVGAAGELYLAGDGLSRGYASRPAMTAERFIPCPFGPPGARMYRVMDRVRRRADGEIEYLGRTDFQVKVRGFRIEPGEIEARLAEHGDVREAVVVAREDAPGDRRLVAYYVGEAVETDALRAHLSQRLPEYMVPAAYVRLEALPLTPNGKVDRGALPAPARAASDAGYLAPRLPLEKTVAAIWAEVLGVERVGVRENFFDLGGHSLLLPRVQTRLQETLGRDVPLMDLFRFPTVAALARHLDPGAPARVAEAPAAERGRGARGGSGAFAVVGMAGRFPGAPDVERFWSNLRDGVHSVTASSDEALVEAGVKPALLRDPAFVRSQGVLEGIDLFDAAFFGINPREAEILDPQQRIFMETAWEALENAGHVPGNTRERVGVFAGSGGGSYFTRHVMDNPEVAGAGSLQAHLGNGKDFLALRAAYELNLRGPALTVQTACSTGLVAVHLACQALAAGECDLALAGGVAINPGRGYRYTPGGIMSPDGHCRAFDARAGGTVGGSGAALVVLRRLEDALADGDTIHAVVLGSAVNNDGSQKVGFTAPSVDAQAEVVALALAHAGVEAESIGFVEAHGSGTELGDPVEVTALSQAFGPAPRRQSVALGSVKTNIGHLDAAAGAAGLIKAVLAVEHGQVPPTLHFAEPNPRIDFAASPFFVNTELSPWPGEGSTPRRAGVTSLGMGGTNAHVVLEEAPPAAPSVPARDWHLLTLSARTPEALEAATDRLAAHLRAHPEQALADVAYTLQVGREAFAHRRTLVARDAEDAAEALEARTAGRFFAGVAPEAARRVAFVFPGLGNHHAGMGRGVYETEPVFREVVDRCAEILLPWLGMDVREVLYGDEEPAPEGAGSGIDLRALLGRAGRDEGAGALTGTRLAQPAMFVTEYALAQLWMHWGVRPDAMIGHSLGEYVAATVAGVWSLEDALMLVAERARLMEETPPGGMMGLGFTEEEIAPYLRDGLCIGARNGPSINVVSGPAAAVDALQAEMVARGQPLRRLPAKHAFHSRLMEPVADRLAERMRGVRLHPPTLPFTSSVTGTWITAEEATDPEYWRRHLVSTVRFSEGVETLAAAGIDLMLEVGAGNTVGGLALQHPVWGKRRPSLVVALRHQFEVYPDDAFLLGAAGRLWAAGVEMDWAAVHEHERLRRVPLPAYPFERRRYWLEPRASSAPARARRGDPLARKPDPADWLYLPAWTRAELPARTPLAPAEWLVLADEGGLGGRLAGRLQTLGHTVVVAQAGDRFARVGDVRYTLRPGSAEDLAALRDDLWAAGIRPRRVVHLWGIGADDGGDADAFARAQARGLVTVTALAAAFAQGAPGDPLQLTVVTEGVRDVSGGEAVRPERATVLGACLALPHEHPRLSCRTVDICPGAGGIDRLVDQLADEVAADAGDDAVALRGAWRWVLGYQAARPREGAAGVRQGGAYLFSGGMGWGTEVLAEHLAGVGARIAVVVDPAFPAREAWDAHPGSSAAALTIRGIRAAEARGGEVLILRAAEARGGEVLILRAAPGDAAALGAAVAAAGEAFGVLHGVIHTATPGTGGDPSGASSSAAVARELAALDDATAGLPLDFRLLQNSLFSVFGGAGVAATAAFVVMDAWAQRRAGEGARWTSVSWDRWQLEEGGGAYAEAAIQRGDGARVFESVAALAREPRVVVSTHDLGARIERIRPVQATAARPDEAGSPDGTARPGPAMHPRPRVESQYLPPASEAETILARIWGELLGFQEVGVQDSFFDLGGHSLLGIRLLARVREAFRVELPLRAVFEAPTISGLAALVDQAILEELDAMSEEEAERALAGLGTGFGAVPAA